MAEVRNEARGPGRVAIEVVREPGPRGLRAAPEHAFCIPEVRERDLLELDLRASLLKLAG